MRVMRIALIVAVLFAIVPSVGAKKGDGDYRTGFTYWQAVDGGFSGWSMNGVNISNDAILLDTATQGTDPYAPGSYFGKRRGLR